jgi:formate/nitrite transporter FocA (FNT family)
VLHPGGLLLKQAHAVTTTKTAVDLSHLTSPSFFPHNLLPVTIGKVIGGALMVGIIYWLV